MRWAARAAWALFIAGGITPAFSATPLDNGTPDQAAAPPAAAPSIEGVMGKKLISVEGSVIALSASEGRLTREITAPNGTVQRTTFRFISERLGTVMDPRDGSKAAGVFRIGSGDINIQYADGGSETLVVNSEGGISIETKAPQSGSYCTLWYPEGHVFSLEERKLALAQYANRLGLADGDKKTDRNDAQPACTTTSVAEVVKAESKSTAKPDVKTAATNSAAALATAVPSGAAAKSPALRTAQSVRVTKGTPKAADSVETRVVEVRDSQVHLVDIMPAEPTPADAAAAPAPQKLASLTPNQGTATIDPKGASTCLSVDSDGSHWGFRNHCEFTVQFAYCLKGDNSPASCKDGAVVGSVSGKGFGALIADKSLKEINGSHDFRWIACQGGAGEVLPRLDEIDPPSGRCVR